MSDLGRSSRLPAAADTTFKAAYTRSRNENSAAALEFVKTCLTLAREQASAQEAAGVRVVEKKTDSAIVVVNRKLPAIEVDPPSLRCGTGSCGDLTIKSVGVARLQVTPIDVTGPDSDAFRPSDDCANQWLSPGTSCRMTVGFEPSGDGERNATLVIHENLPKPDTGTRVPLTGSSSGTGGAGDGRFTLTVEAAEGVRITSDAGGIECGDTCQGTFPADTDVILTAVHDGARQVDWDGCDTVDGDTCQVHVTADMRVGANLSGPN